MAFSFSSAAEYDADTLTPKVTETNSGYSSPLAGKDYEEGECCGDSGDLIRVEEADSHLGFKRGESTSSNSGEQDESANNSFPELDSLETEWTDEKHSSYLDSIEASFVKKMYNREYCSRDLCGQSPKEMAALDPDSAESRLNFPSPFSEFKVLQKGSWRKLPYADKSQHLPFSSVGGCTWIQHFRAPASKNQAVPASIAKGSGRNRMVKRIVMLKHLGPINVPMGKPPNASQGSHDAWYDRLQSNSSCWRQTNYNGSTSSKGKRKLSTTFHRELVSDHSAGMKLHERFALCCTLHWKIKGDNVTEMIQWNKSQETDQNLEDSPEKEITPKKQKVNVHCGCKSPEDQVVPFVKIADSKEAGDCNYPSRIQGFRTYTNQQPNNSINFLSGENKSTTSFLKHMQLPENVGTFTKDDCSSKLILNEGESWECCKE